jgi:ParB family transcriptional regulator, chromosome partitioning protein
MGSDAKKAFNAIGRDELLWFAPETLTIVEDETSALADPDRLAGPPPEWLVESILADGIDVPIIVRLNGKRDDGTPIVEVVNGRQRVRSAREANKRIAAANKKLAPEERAEPIRVPGVRTRGEDHAMLAKMVRSNVLFVEETPLSKARKAVRLLEMGRSYDEVARQFGVIEKTIKSWEALLGLDVSVQKAVEQGELPPTTATKLAGLPQAEQKAALEKMRADGALKGKSGREAAERATGRDRGKTEPEEGGATLPSRVWMKRLRAELGSPGDGTSIADLDELAAAEQTGAMKVLALLLDGKKPRGGPVAEAWRALQKRFDRKASVDAGAEE